MYSSTAYLTLQPLYIIKLVVVLPITEVVRQKMAVVRQLVNLVRQIVILFLSLCV